MSVISSIGQRLVSAVALVGLSTAPVGCAMHREQRAPTYTLKPIAQTTQQQWTGVAVNKAGRVFVNFPRWSEGGTLSVAEVREGGVLRPFPNERLNGADWSENPRARLVAVQSVYVDGENNLWILDTGNPYFRGVVSGAAKLLRVDLRTDQVVQVIRFSPAIALKGSYLNDIRVDEQRHIAYLSDSGVGGVIVVDLVSGRSRRLLSDIPVTRSEGLDVVIDGEPWRMGAERQIKPEVHADGIALSPDGDWLYFQALTGKTLYRVPTEALRDLKRSHAEVVSVVERVRETFPVDGMIFGTDGALYLTALEQSALWRFDPSSGEFAELVSDPRLAWPDSLSWSPSGALVVSTARIHQMPRPMGPYGIFEIRRAER